MARTPKIVEDRREQIIDAALRIFSQKGFLKATNKDIARAAGITPGLIYYYFDSKEALLQAILETRSPLTVLTTLPPQVLALPPEMFFRFLIPRALGIIEGENFIGLFRVLLPEMIYHPEMAAIPRGIIDHVIEILSGYLSAKIEAGELRSVDAALAAQTFLGCVIGFVLRRQILRDPSVLAYSHEEIANVIIDTVFQGLIPR
ncbi:MAG: TetR/AcrR family transcriptional regulator [Chloroflexota bacterium]|nr:TetR/AcrR family transcriptional regulator [Chloroflexota bacterium]